VFDAVGTCDISADGRSLPVGPEVLEHALLLPDALLRQRRESTSEMPVRVNTFGRPEPAEQDYALAMAHSTGSTAFTNNSRLIDGPS
jgi:hypothetical protein